MWLNLQALFCENKEATAFQLESDLQNISMGDLTTHEYYTKIKKFLALLEGLGEPVKEKHLVMHTINELSTKYDNLAGILRFSKPSPSFVEFRSNL